MCKTKIQQAVVDHMRDAAAWRRGKVEELKRKEAHDIEKNENYADSAEMLATYVKSLPPSDPGFSKLLSNHSMFNVIQMSFLTQKSKELRFPGI